MITATDDGIIAIATDQDVAVGGSIDGVVSALAKNCIFTRSTVQRVVARVREPCRIAFDEVRAVANAFISD